MTKEKASNKRDWLSLLIVPIFLLILSWWYTNRTEDRINSIEFKKTKVELLTSLLEHMWMNTIYIEEIIPAKNNMSENNKQVYFEAKRKLNESYSSLYVDMIKLQVMFDDTTALKLSNKLREYIALGGDNDATKEYTESYSGRVKDTWSDIQFMILDLLKKTTNSKYLKNDW
jgi:hypothetical protein